MTTTTAVRLLLFQTALMVGLAWGVVYLGRDEYRLALGREDDELPTISQARADEEGGPPALRLSESAQRRVGIELAAPTEASLSPQGGLRLSVVDPQPLLDGRARLSAVDQSLAQAQAASRSSEAERQRVQGLFNDDRNASQRSLDIATAQAATDSAQLRQAQAQQQAVRDALRLGWGSTLAAAMGTGPDPAARKALPMAAADNGKGSMLADLLAGRSVLLRLVLRADDVQPPPARLQLQLPGRKDSASARYLATVPASSMGAASAETGLGGRHLLYLAPGAGLSAGMVVMARSAPQGEQSSGMLLPATAVIWHAGQPWIYVRESGADTDSEDEGKGQARAPAASGAPASGPGPSSTTAPKLDRFQRIAIPRAQRVGEQWFVPGLAEDGPVVVRGAQVLLSEELKFQIKNENDD